MNDNHKTIVKNTLMNHYISEDRNALIGMLRSDDVIYTNSNLKGEVKEGILDCRGLKNEEIIEKCLNENDMLINYLNQYKVDKSYRYSVIFNYTYLDESLLADLISKNKAQKPEYNNIILTQIAERPEVLNDDDKLIFVFNFIKKSNFADDNGLDIFYNVLLVFHKNINTLEVRLDGISNKFKNNQNSSEFYERMIKSVLVWAQSQLKLVFENVDVESIANYIKKNKQEEIAVASVQMQNQYLTNSNLVAFIKDGKHILPIIDELKIFGQENDNLFDKVPELKENFSLFIKQIEETSTYPQITLCWIKKGLDFKVELSHNYENQGYTLLKHKGRNKKMEEMTYVTEYLIQCKEDSKGLANS